MKTAQEIIRDTQEARRTHDHAGMTPNARALLGEELGRLVREASWIAGTRNHLTRNLAIEYIYQLGRRDMLEDGRQGMVSMPAVTYVP